MNILTEQEKASAILNIQANALEKENSSNSYELLKRHTSENHPFTIIEDVEKGECMITLGKYKLSEAKSLNDCKDMITDRSYELLLTMMSAIIGLHEEVKNQIPMEVIMTGEKKIKM
nr:MAG: hypothetical protein [Microviridae sp.]